MEASRQAIPTRLEIIHSKLLAGNSLIGQSWSRDTLLDAFVSYFEECSADYLKENKDVAKFVETYRLTINELKRLRVNIADFEVVSLIGQGNFGTVHLVKERQTGELYAMKTIRKSQTINNKQTCFVAEREIMATSTSSWHTLLQYAFHDSTKLYLVMDYHPGGDLRGLLERRGNVLEEDEAVFYLREIIISISHVHDLGYIHRDIKPDNLLLDREGHIKLADFGSAARTTSEGVVAHKDNIAAGTPDYIAPEVLLSHGKPNKVYGRSCDYWSLGIIAYEMIFGATPFTGATTAETYNNIILFEQKLVIPEDVDVDKKYSSFVKQLLTDELIRPDYEKIICTPLFRDTCWETVREFDPPFVPTLNDREDTSLFTGVQLQPQPPNIENFLAKSNFSGRNLPFIGFTYSAAPPDEEFSGLGGPMRKDVYMLERNHRKIESLRNRLVEFETLKEDQVELEEKYEQCKLVLNSAKIIRATIEKDLAAAMTESASLRKTLEAERNERKDLELRAIDLIRSAKERWKAEEDVRNAELQVLVDTQTQQITELTTANNELTQKLHKVTETAASAAKELERLRDVQEEYENQLKRSRNQARKSFCGLQDQLRLVSDDAEERVESLKKELEDAWDRNRNIQEQVEDIRLQNKLLESKLKTNEADYKTKLSERDAEIETLSQAQTLILSKLSASNKRENNLQDKITVLQEEKAKLKSKYEQTADEMQSRERECEQLRTLYRTNSDKLNGNLEIAVAEQKAKDEFRAKNLQNTIRKLEKEIITLMPQIKEYETSKTKIAELESLVARLEAGKHKDAAATAREDLLTEQLDKSQNKVKELHESAALSNRELSKIKGELSAKEKLLKDTSIDARILSRELQDAQKEIKTLEKQVKVCEERTKKAEDLASVEQKRARAADTKHLALVNENAELKNRVACLETQAQKLATVEAEATSLKTLKQELEQMIEAQQKELSDYSKTAATAKQLEISTKLEMSRLRADLDAQHTAYAALQESCTILEQQVDGYDRLVITLKNKEASLELKVIGLENDLEAVQEILQSTKQTLMIARNDRIALDTTIRLLEVQMADLESEKQSMNEDLARFERRYNELVASSNDTEQEKNQALLNIQNLQSQINTLKIEIRQLKEESSERLTHLLQAREVNAIINEELIEQRDEIDKLTETLCETKFFRDESQQRAHDEIVSLEIRLKQFEKVSDSLLDRLAIEERKKKSIAKIFHKKNPEPPRPSTYYDLYKQFTALQADYNELKLKYQSLESALETPMSMRVRKAMAHASMEDARDAQAIAAARLAKAAVDARKGLAAYEEQKALQEAGLAKLAADDRESRAVEAVKRAETLVELEQMKEASEIRMATAAREAAAWRPIRATDIEASETRTALQLRKFKAASESRKIARAASLISESHAGAAPVAQQPTMQRSPSPTEQDTATSRPETHCFLHFSCMAGRKCRWCWQPIELLRSAVKCKTCGIIVHKTCQGLVSQSCGIADVLWEHYINITGDLKPETPVFDPENDVCKVHFHLCGKRLPRYLHYANNTVYLHTEIPTAGNYTQSDAYYPLELPGFRFSIITDISGRYDRCVAVYFYDTKPSTTPPTPFTRFMLEFCGDWEREAFIDAILSENSSNLIPTSDTFIYPIKTFSSVLELSSMLKLNNLFLMGGAQGLHVVPFETDQVFTFSTYKNVQQISLLSAINSIIIIAGTEGELVRLDLTQFLNLDTVAVSNTILNSSPIKISNHSEAILLFQCSVVNNIAMVCAATAKQIIVLHFDSDANDFQSVRVLDSAEPCSALVIYRHSLFISADKFFNLDLITFKVREMMDATDPGLAHVSACQRAGTYPALAICLSMNPPEYMLCYSEFAVFVDEHGRKSRRAQITWKHFPLHFVYNPPNLFVLQFSAIEVFRVSLEIDANNREQWTCPPSIRIELIRPKYLTENEHGIYVSCLEQHDVSSKHMYEQVCFVSGTMTPK